MFQATETQDLLALADALECAITKTDDEIKRKRAKPYERALMGQKTRYVDLLGKVADAMGTNSTPKSLKSVQ